MFIFLISRLAARRVVHCVGPPSYRKSPIPSFPRLYSSCPASHHAIPVVLFVMPRLASRHSRNHHVIPATITSFLQPSRHSREGGNLTPHFRRAFLDTPPPRYIERNRSAKIVDRVVAIQVEFS